MNCYRCDLEISSANASNEHIILNACGGRLKSKKLLCKSCNSIFGNRFDHELAKTTNDLANLLMIKRQDGKPQSISTARTKTGEKYFLELGGHPVQSKTIYEIDSKEEQNQLQIQAKNRTELRKTLQGLKRKYPGIDIQKALDTAEDSEFYINDSFEINSSIGGEAAFKSVAKSAINYFIYNEGESKYIKHLIPYLEGKEEAEVVWMHYPDKDVYAYNQEDVTHVLKIVGDSTEKILYAYVELFNTHNFIIRLNMEYDGIDMDRDYIFNVHTYKTQTKRTNLKLNRKGLEKLFSNRNTKSFEQVQKRYARVLNIAYKIQDKHQINEIVTRAIYNTLGTLSEGDDIDESTLVTVYKEVTEKMMAYIAHRNNMRNIK